MDIAEALKERGYEIDRRRINLRDAIKEVGDYSVTVRLHRDVNVEIPVVVADERAAQTAAPAATPAATEETTTGAEEAAEGAEA
jgi:large subunit ribosomal protein L9